MVNYFRLTLKTKAEQSIRALDFGCGAGTSSSMIIERFPKIDLYGVDISSKAISSAKTKGLKVRWLQPNNSMQFPNQYFDADIRGVRYALCCKLSITTKHLSRSKT